MRAIACVTEGSGEVILNSKVVVTWKGGRQ